MKKSLKYLICAVDGLLLSVIAYLMGFANPSGLGLIFLIFSGITYLLFSTLELFTKEE